MDEKVSTREVAGKTLVELGEDHPNLVILGGDLNKSTFANLFGAKYPERFFDFGAAEQNIVGVAAGMAGVSVNAGVSVRAGGAARAGINAGFSSRATAGAAWGNFTSSFFFFSSLIINVKNSIF